MSDFIHLHNHTHYSLQDGACTVDSLVNAAVKNNMPSVALTDHGVMYGVAEFIKKTKKAGIKPIVGMEAYITDGSRFDKGEAYAGTKKRRYYHLILLAKNVQGYENLRKLTTLGHTEGYYYRPRIDFELLSKYKDGLVCTSACAGGVVSAHLINNDYDKAREVALQYYELFGDDFYLEIQDHDMEVEKPVLELMPKLSKELGIKLVATNDCHYVEKDHAIAHNIMLLLSDKEGRDYRDLRYGTDQIYFKSSDEMTKLFKNYKGAVENTLEIDEKINFKMESGGYHFPVFPIPEESPAKTLDDYLELLAKEGLDKKYPNADQSIIDRFNFEIQTIKDMGYSGYFLIVQDFINASKKKGIPVGPGRGSAAGSLVAYALGITGVDPLPYDLLFERFLNPARKSMPDIDVDFADDKRGEVIDYVKEKYGNHCVSQIITFSRLSSKAVLKDVARVLKIPIPVVSKITKYIPSTFGKVASVEEAINTVPELKWVKESTDESILTLIKYAKILEGMNRGSGKHAAGVVIAPGDVSDYIPLATAVSSQTELVTQFNMKEVEEQGLLKMDFLGLRTLTIIRDTCTLIEELHGIKIDIDAIPLDDEKTFQLFTKGQTTGVFQFESAPMREYLKRLKPTGIKDLAAMNALYRPGPMKYIDDFIERKYGRKKVEYLHPLMEPILKETYGIIVYQEQVIQIANKVAGMTLAEADILRRAMGKKDAAIMEEQKAVFVKKAVDNGINEKTAKEIFDVILEFANYGFNKSHSVAYSVVAYQTAYLKAHYLPEFLASNLTNEFTNANKVADLLNDCRKLKIRVLPPNINNATSSFTVEKGKIRFGMSAIKNVGVKAVHEIIRGRKELERDFTSIFDFTSNVDTRIVNKRVLEGLVLAGAFDSINTNRLQLYYAVEQALSFGYKASSIKTSSEGGLFGDFAEEVKLNEPALPKAEPWTEMEKLSKEREVLGFYVTGHPLTKYEIDVKSFSQVKLGEASELENVEMIRTCGVITDITLKIDKSGKQMAFFKLEDFSGQCECMMFSKVYTKYDKYVADEACVYVSGKPESSGDAIKINIEDVTPLQTIRETCIDKLLINFDSARFSLFQLEELKKSLNRSKQGNTFILLNVLEEDGSQNCYKLNYKIKVEDQFIEKITSIFGEESIIFTKK